MKRVQKSDAAEAPDAPATESVAQSIIAAVALRTGNPRQMPPPVEGYLDTLPPGAVAALQDVLSCSAIGSADKVNAGIEAFAKRTNADEIIVAASIFDHEKRKRSLEITASTFEAVPA
jgi:alkanesulfonate monooxygenase SsuD/methylene tetrahydromethanopterin reductase-like flavin-dependent oxidoreductase (luciferase family)